MSHLLPPKPTALISIEFDVGECVGVLLDVNENIRRASSALAQFPELTFRVRFVCYLYATRRLLKGNDIAAWSHVLFPMVSRPATHSHLPVVSSSLLLFLDRYICAPLRLWL